MRSILAVMVVGLALAGCNTSYNYFEDDTEGAADPGPFNLAQSLMQHAGVVEKEKARVAYKPRAPLAMPGTNSLPSPESRSGQNEAEAAVNFPTDHEDAEAQRKADLRTALAANDDPSAMRDDDDNVTSQRYARLPAEALAEPEAQRDNSEIFRDKTGVEVMKDLRNKVTFRRPGQATLTEDGKAAPRQYLTQPPDEYRTPADTAPIPEEGDIENSEWINKQLYRNAPGKAHTYVQN